MTGILGGLIGSLSRILSWISGTMSNALSHTAAAYAPLSNGSFFAFGAAANNITNPTNLYNYSTDGLSWSSGTLPSTIQARAAASNGSRVVVASTTNTAFRSDNGTTWTTTGSMGNGIIKTEGLWDGSRFVFATSTSSSGIVYSTDGDNWNIYANAIASGIGFDGVNTYITVNQNSSTARINTTNITSFAAWSNITLPSGIAWSSIKHNGSIWVAAAGNSSSYATSVDGVSWTARTLPATLTGSGTAIRPKMAVFQGRFYYLNTSSPNFRIYSSADGINWTLDATVSSTLAAAQAWAVSPISLIGFGMATSTNGSSRFARGG